MERSKLNIYWSLIIILLVAIVAFSSFVVWSKYRSDQPIEISLPQAQELEGEIYIDGAVSNPGRYPLNTSDSIATLIQRAGGTSDNADLGRLKLYIPWTVEEEPAQKIDINRAEAWLLMALPGIGETRAKAIVKYRSQHGPFRHISELTNVDGIGIITYEQIKHLITVAD